MSSVSLINHTDQLNSFSHEKFDSNEYKQKLIDRLEGNHQNGVSFLDTVEELRQEQRLRLQQAERDYYNEKARESLDLSDHIHRQEKKITSKPPLPKSSKQLPSPALLTEERAQQRAHNRSISSNIIRRHDDDIAFCPHRCDGATVHDLQTQHIKNKIKNMWNEFELEDYLERKKPRPLSASESWAGRKTVPEPFSLTNSMNVDNIHRQKCIPEFEASKLYKEVEEEINLSHSFKAKPVPAHVHMPLYQKLRDEQRVRSEQVRNMTRDYLSSIVKPFNFESREKVKSIIRRHSYSGGDFIHPDSQFKARPLPQFYYETHQDHEHLNEQSVYRSIRKDIRAKKLLQKSKLPFSERKSRFSRRSMSTNDLARMNLQEYSFKPKTNGYYVPNYDKMYSKFLQETENAKRRRSPTKCKPFLLYTNLIQSKKDKILDDIRNDEQIKHSKTFEIKGKKMPKRASSALNLSSSFQQAEAIPTKTTDAQRLREAIGKKKRKDEELRYQTDDAIQRAKSAKERKVRERIRERAKLNDQAIVTKAKREENFRQLRQSMQKSEDDYAKGLEEMNRRLENRPLLLERNAREKAIRELKKKFERAMKIAHVTEDDLIREQPISPNVRLITTATDQSA